VIAALQPGHHRLFPSQLLGQSTLGQTALAAMADQPQRHITSQLGRIPLLSDLGILQRFGQDLVR
jgi:hypothetical protein